MTIRRYGAEIELRQAGRYTDVFINGKHRRRVLGVDAAKKWALRTARRNSPWWRIW